MRLLLFLVATALLLNSVAEAQKLSLQKISPTLDLYIKDLKSNSRDSVDVVIALKRADSLIKKHLQIISTNEDLNIVQGRIALVDVEILASNPNVIFVEKMRVPKEELTSGNIDFTINKVRYAQNEFPATNGKGITASIKEQNFDVADIDFKGRIITTASAANTVSSHASIMTTIIGGGGNSSVNAKGVAPGVNLSSSDFAVLLPDADAVYKANNISLQNHSYGTGIENYYGADAAAYDRSVWQNKSLVHVFSAGNSGSSASSTGLYKEMQGFANLTGSFKMAKNIITVGHVDSFNTVMALSSKGPAFDGRVKPELVAFGADGSSGAAALVSGTVALLQQAYQEQHNATYPSSQLVKAVLINSADDVGSLHVDYASGYGSLNAYQAIHAITSNTFIENVVHQNEIKTFPFSIPGNVKQVKITLVWTDTPSIANTSKALVNDLDISLKSNGAGEVWLPWVLSSFPHKDSLLLPAVRKKDTLNNVEQITIDLPQAGDYRIEVKGTLIAGFSQNFAIAWQMDTVNKFLWTYPSSSDALKAGEPNVIRWETNKTGRSTLQYAQSGNDWQTVDNTIDLSQPYYQWIAPDTFISVQLRLIDSAGKKNTSDQFVLSKPIQLKVGFDCADSFLLYWNKLPADQYRLYQLGEKYLEPIGTTRDTLVIFKKPEHASLYYSVAPLLNNKEAPRSVTINYNTQGVACYLKNFLVSLQNNSGILNAELGSLYNISSVSFQKINFSDTQTIKTFSQFSGTVISFADLSLTKGLNSYRLLIQLSDGSKVYSPIESIYFFTNIPVLIYPNPAKQNEPIHLVVRDPFVYSMQVFDAAGRLVHKQLLDDLTNEFSPLHLSKGFYFIKIVTESGKLQTQKLIVQ